MSRLKTPIICVVIGGGAQEALGIGVGDRIVMLEYSYYSISLKAVRQFYGKMRKPVKQQKLRGYRSTP